MRRQAYIHQGRAIALRTLTRLSLLQSSGGKVYGSYRITSPNTNKFIGLSGTSVESTFEISADADDTWVVPGEIGEFGIVMQTRSAVTGGLEVYFTRADTSEIKFEPVQISPD